MAAFVKSVERITTTFSASTSLLTNVVNLTKGQDEAQCVPFYTMRFTGPGASDAKVNNAVSVEFFDNAGTPAARIRRVAALAGGSVQVEIYIVEFSSAVTVQRGVTSLTATTATATISSVTQDNAFIVHTQHAQNSSNDDDFNEFFLQSKFNSDTEISFERYDSGSQNWDVYWYVVESNGVDFKTEYVEIPWFGSQSSPNTATLSNAVTLDNAFLVSTYRSNELGDSLRDAVANLALTGPTTLSLYWQDVSSRPGNAGVWVVRATASELTTQRFATDVKAPLITDQPITSVDLDKAAVIPSSNVGGHGWAIDTSTFGFDSARRQHTTILTSATNAQSQRSESPNIGETGILRYEVVEFEIAAPPSGIVVAPGAANVAADGINPEVVLGSLGLAPAEALAIAAAIDPIVDEGGPIIVEPVAAIVSAEAVDPLIELGDLVIEPAIAVASAEAVDPVVELGSIIVNPVQALAVSSAETGDPILGSLILTPGTSLTATAAVDPVVIIFPEDVIAPAYAVAGVSADLTIVVPGLVIAPVAAGALAEALVGSIFPQLWWETEDPLPDTWTPESPAPDGWTPEDPV